MGEADDRRFDRLPDGATGFWRVSTEHGTVFHFLFGDEASGWVRTPGVRKDGLRNAAASDGRWRPLRFGPCLTEWREGARAPQPVSDDGGWPVPGLAVGYGLWVGESMFTDHWLSTVVVSIEPVSEEALPAEVHVGLASWLWAQFLADLDDQS